MPKTTLSCDWCGAGFVAEHRGGRPPVVCSPKCKVERERERCRAKASHVVGCRECQTCGDEFSVRASRRDQKFCSRECLHEYLRRDHGEATCPHCGDVFERTKDKSKFCSRECQWSSYRRNFPRSLVYFLNCEICGSLFCSKVAHGKYCSAKCRDRRQVDVAGDRVNSLYALATQFSDGQYAGLKWRRALLQYLVDRDGDRCGICNRKVDITLKSGTRGSRRGPSVDHIVPRSLGGSDDLSNLRLAHWGCNQKRGNRAKDEQLALVG